MKGVDCRPDGRLRVGPTAQWLIVGLLAVIAAGLWTLPRSGGLEAAMAQVPPLAGARGVYAFTGQLDATHYGLFMLDVDQGTIWCYELENVGGARKLRLIAARTWIYDRYLQDFNNAPPDFRTVQKLVAEQRARGGEHSNLTDEAGQTVPAPEPGRPEK